MMAEQIADYAAGEPVVMIGAGSGMDEVAAAVAAGAGREVVAIRWDEVDHRLARQVGAALLVIEAAGVREEAVAAALPTLAEAAVARGVPVVAAFEESQLDLFAAHFLGEAALLCAPSMVERVAAVTLALEVGRRDRLHDAAREAEAARLRRLNEEVARIAETLARLSREGDTRRAPSVADRMIGYGAPPAISAPASVPALEIRAAIRTRRLRDKIMPGGLFEDPAWDMLLDLAAAELEHAQVSVSSLCIASAVAPTTALRWIGKLTEAGLVERRPDPFDRRRAYMGLTERGRTGMRRYFETVSGEGLAIA